MDSIIQLSKPNIACYKLTFHLNLPIAMSKRGAVKVSPAVVVIQSSDAQRSLSKYPVNALIIEAMVDFCSSF